MYYACKDLNNFGDVFNIWLAEKLTGNKHEFTDDKSLMCCGSILSEANEDTNVFGCGFGNLFETSEAVNIYALRGYYSYIQLSNCGWIQDDKFIGLFDPMQTISEFFESKQGKGLGIIRHYVDFEEQQVYDEINVCDGVDNVIDFIQQHDEIVTSSLHVLIAADVLGKKTRLVKFSDKIHTDGFKYADYFSVAGYKGYKPDYLTSLDECIGIAIKQPYEPLQAGMINRYFNELTIKLNDISNNTVL